MRSMWLTIFVLSSPSFAAVTVYPAPTDYPANDRFAVTFDGTPAHVYDADVADLQKWPRYPAPMMRKTVGFASCDTAGPVTVRVEVRGETPRSARVRPASKDITAKLDGRTITFTMPRPDNLIVELNGDLFDHLYLFVNPPETDRPDPDDPKVTYFGPGVHDAGLIQPTDDGRTIYLAGGAVVKSYIHVEGLNDLTIRGRGILTGTGQARGSYLVRPRGCSNLVIQDVILLDSPTWTLRMENCRDVVVRNLRQICYMQNSDGIDPYSCQDVLIDQVFLRNYDDNVVVKALRDGQPSERIVTRRSTMIADHGTALKCGFNETLGPRIGDVVFEDCDVLSSRGRALGLLLNGPSNIENVRFENIRVEEPLVNPSHNRDGLPTAPTYIELLIEKGNGYLSNYMPGHIHGIVFKDISCTSLAGQPPPLVTLDGLHDASSIADVTFDNVTLDGQPIAPDHPAVRLGPAVFNVRFQPAGGPAVVALPRAEPLPAPVQPATPPLPSPEPELAADGSIVFEAETGQLGGRMKPWSDDPRASGGWYLVSGPRSGAQDAAPGKSSQAVYDFVITKPGRYRFDGLVLAPSQQANSFWVKVDDGPWIAWTNLPVSADWQWAEVADSQAKNAALELDLAAGQHRFYLASREDDTAVDRLRIRPR